MYTDSEWSVAGFVRFIAGLDRVYTEIPPATQPGKNFSKRAALCLEFSGEGIPCKDFGFGGRQVERENDSIRTGTSERKGILGESAFATLLAEFEVSFAQLFDRPDYPHVLDPVLVDIDEFHDAVGFEEQVPQFSW